MDARTFVAEDAWLFVAVITLPLAGLASVLGMPIVPEVIGITGWLLFTPILLFWGEEIASAVFGAKADEPGTESDPVAMLKRRYAEGDIDEAELERRLGTIYDTDLSLQSLEQDDAERVRETDQ